MHPDWESNPQPLSVRDSDSTNRATRPGQHGPSIQGKHNYTGSLPQPQGHGLEFLHLSDSHSLSPSGRPAQLQGAGLELPGCSGLSPRAHTGGRWLGSSLAGPQGTDVLWVPNLGLGMPLAFPSHDAQLLLSVKTEFLFLEHPSLACRGSPHASIQPCS